MARAVDTAEGVARLLEALADVGSAQEKAFLEGDVGCALRLGNRRMDLLDQLRRDLEREPGPERLYPQLREAKAAALRAMRAGRKLRRRMAEEMESLARQGEALRHYRGQGSRDPRYVDRPG